MPNRDIIVVGTSEGGLRALTELVKGLPDDLEAAVFVVQHIAPHFHSILPNLLGGLGKLPTRNAISGEPIRLGRIYVAPPDSHLLLERDSVRLTQGPKENRFRPAIDPLFRTAAYSFGPRVIGVILTGALNDGTAGLWAIKERGGVAVVQDPGQAQNPSMPLSVLRYVNVDLCLPLSEIGPALARLVREGAETEGGPTMSDELEIESKLALQHEPLHFDVLKLGPPSGFTCPECHGALVQIQEGNLLRYRCHTGHGFTVDSLMNELKDSIEDALWNAIRVTQESAMLMAHIARHAAASNDHRLAELLRHKTHHAQQRAELLRSIATSNDTATAESLHDEALVAAPEAAGRRG